MILERLQLAGAIKARLEEMKAGGTIEIMLNIILRFHKSFTGAPVSFLDIQAASTM